MQATDIFFIAFALLALLCGFLVIVNRNPVNSAMFLVLTIASLAGLFVLLNAFFLAAVQVLVYAGAVMVLFLFVIMLLDLKEEQRRRANKFGWITGIGSVGAILAVFLRALAEARTPGSLAPPVLEGATRPLGKMLFSDYLLPFEILS